MLGCQIRRLLTQWDVCRVWDNIPSECVTGRITLRKGSGFLCRRNGQLFRDTHPAAFFSGALVPHLQYADDYISFLFLLMWSPHPARFSVQVFLSWNNHTSNGVQVHQCSLDSKQLRSVFYPLHLKGGIDSGDRLLGTSTRFFEPSKASHFF